jgi:hypothetical protein
MNGQAACPTKKNIASQKDRSMRGFMLDSARALESRTYYRQFVDFIAQRDCDTILWHFSDDQGCSLRFESLPEAASPHAYSKQEMRELIAYARERGVTLIPELETLGHTRFITRARADLADLSERDDLFTSLCPVDPRTRQIVGELLDEVCDLFPSDLVHVGLDEVRFGDHPLTREAMKTRSATDLFAEHVLFLHERLKRHGKRMFMWGDHLLDDHDLAQRVPRDVLVGNWQYEPVVPLETTVQLLNWGFEVISCPALICHEQPLYPSVQRTIANLRSTAEIDEAQPTKGTLTTIWMPQRYLNRALWPAVHVATDFMRHGPAVDVAASLSGYLSQYHEMAPTPDQVGALHRLFSAVPERETWVSAVKLDLDELDQAVDARREAEQWSAVVEALAASRPSDVREPESYDTIVLLAEVVAHVWQRLDEASAGAVQPATIRQSESLLHRLSDCWDVERFADDPRKWNAVIDFHVDDYLLISFRRGTERLKSLAAAGGAQR